MSDINLTLKIMKFSYLLIKFKLMFTSLSAPDDKIVVKLLI